MKLLSRSIGVALVCITACGGGSGSLDRTNGSEALEPVLAQARRVIDVSDRSSTVWPGFDLTGMVLIGAINPDGPVILIGDPHPPPEYRPSSVMPGVYLREGPPPDSLRGLRLALDWNGGTANATAVGFMPAMLPYLPHVLIHEAFHTHQLRVNRDAPERFDPLPNPSFPDASVSALSLLNLEGSYLTDALLAEDPRVAKQHVRHALAVRAHRCAQLAADECTHERGIEQKEGSATYVASVLLGEVLGYGSDGLWQDSLARALSPLRDLSRLERWHFYDTGHVWLRLIERFFPERAWQAAVELSPPDRVLARYLGVEQPDTARIASLMSGMRWERARTSASEAITALVAERDRQDRQFRERPGVPFIVLFGRVSSLRTTQGLDDDGTRRRTVRFNGNKVSFIGPSTEFCCPPGERTIAAVSDAVATVDGIEVPLDTPTTAAGSIHVDLNSVQAELPSARLEVF